MGEVAGTLICAARRLITSYPAVMQPRNIPGFPEVVEWPTRPVRPLRVINAEQWRCEGVPAWVVIADATGAEFVFGFDSLLGRLFYGATHESSDEAAWVRPASPLEADVLPFLRDQGSDPRWPWLTDYVERAVHYSGLSRGPAAAG